MSNPLEPRVSFLKNQKTEKEKLDKYFDLWNKYYTYKSYPLPFCTDYNKASYETEKVLYDYLTSLGEPALIINGYQRNTGVTGVTQEPGQIRDIDLLVVHKLYGLLLFEVKDMRKVIQVCNTENKSTSRNLKECVERCPMEMIKHAEMQLSNRWDDIAKYLKQFFGDDLSTKKAWSEYWKMKDETDIHRMINSITKDRCKRSFICLFYYSNQPQVDNVGNLVFTCIRPNCCCSNTGKALISQCQVLDNVTLKSRDTFQSWMRGYFKNNKLGAPYLRL